MKPSALCSRHRPSGEGVFLYCGKARPAKNGFTVYTVRRGPGRGGPLYARLLDKHFQVCSYATPVSRFCGRWSGRVAAL